MTERLPNLPLEDALQFPCYLRIEERELERAG